MIVLDTNVISELVRPAPDQAVIAYLESLPAEEMFTAAVCTAEIHYGLARLPPGRRRDSLTDRMAAFLEAAFGDRILVFDRLCAAAYGEIRTAREAAGRPITALDAMVAATALAYGARALATRNVRAFADCGIPLVDPWQAATPEAD